MRMRWYTAAVAIFMLIYSQTGTPAIKQNYGGNLKVAEELLAGITAQQLFDTTGEKIRPLLPAPVSWEEKSVTIDFSGWGPEAAGEIERSVAGLQNTAHACHWILDYPYLDHRHSTSVQVTDGRLTVSVEDPEVLRDVLSSTCLIPEPVGALQPFQRTQFGYEANAHCVSGRPFLDSITPAPVDPLNPFLSFKLNDADVIPVPEERYSQVSRDPDLVLLPGPKYYVFIRTDGLSASSALSLGPALRIQEIAKAALNGHADVLLNVVPAAPIKPGVRVTLQVPQENPYKLLGERILVQWKDAGIDATPATSGATAQLIAFPVRSANDDVLRYQILRTHYPISDSRPWHEVWDELEATGRVIPLLLHRGTLAMRPIVRDLRTGVGGLPVFADAWIEPNP